MGSTHKLLAYGTDLLLHRLGDPVGLTTPVVSDDGTKPVWIEGDDLGGAATHIADTTDAHDASAISVADAGGYFSSSDVEGALQELGAGGGGPGGVTDRNDIARDYSLIKSECYFQAVGNIHEGGITQAVSGTGAATSTATAEANHPGIIQLSTGTTTTGSCSLTQSGTGKVFIPDTGTTLTAGVIAKIPTLSDGSQGFRVLLIGLGAMVFRYDLATTGANWQARDFNNVDTDTGVAVDTGWHYYEMVLTGTTDCKFYIDGSLVHTETSIGTGAAEILTPATITKAALGGTARTLLLDAYWYQIELTSNR